LSVQIVSFDVAKLIIYFVKTKKKVRFRSNFKLMSFIISFFCVFWLFFKKKDYYVLFT